MPTNQEESSVKGMELEKDRRHEMRLLQCMWDMIRPGRSIPTVCLMQWEALKGFMQKEGMIWFRICDAYLADSSSCYDWCSLPCLFLWWTSLTGRSRRVIYPTYPGSFLHRDFASRVLGLCRHKIPTHTSARGHSWLGFPLGISRFQASRHPQASILGSFFPSCVKEVWFLSLCSVTNY